MNPGSNQGMPPQGMPPQGMPQQGLTAEQAMMKEYRNSLEDCILLIEGLSSVCFSLDDMTALLKFAMVNDSQLALVQSKVAPKGLRKR